MADTIKIGSLDISAFKVGSSDCKIYLGDTLLYSGGTPPTPPTPTYKWVSYNEGDTVPDADTLVYGVKLYLDLGADNEIDFQDSYQGGEGIVFMYVADADGWYGIDMETSSEIDLSSYYDSSEGCYIVLFSDLGYGGLPIMYPASEFEFDVDLYEEYTPTLQWVVLSAGDTIPQGKVYGFKGDSQIVGHYNYNILEIGTDSNNCVTFGHGAPTRAPQYTAYFYLVSSGTPSYIDSWEGGLRTFIFSDYASNGVEEYYNEDGTKTVPFDCQLYIYA